MKLRDARISPKLTHAINADVLRIINVVFPQRQRLTSRAVGSYIGPPHTSLLTRTGRNGKKRKGKRIDTAVSFPCLTELITELHRSSAELRLCF